MRLYLVCPVLLLLGCAASDPEASVTLNDPGERFIILRQVDGMKFQGCTEVVLDSSHSGFQVDAKLVDRGEIQFKDGGEWSVGLTSDVEGLSYASGKSRLTLATANPDEPGRPLKVCVQVSNVDARAYGYSEGPPRRVADLYITLSPPMNP